MTLNKSSIAAAALSLAFAGPLFAADSMSKDQVKAELAAKEKDTPKNRYDVALAKADMEYNVAKEKCDDMKGDEKKACNKDAKSAHDSAKKQAKADRDAAKKS
jgi:hypothetical protein